MVYIRKTNNTSHFDSVHEKKQKIFNVSVVFMKIIQHTSRFDSIDEKNKIYITFR